MSFRLSVSTVTLLLTLCLLVAAGAIAFGAQSGARHHQEASDRATRAIARSDLYEDALNSAYDEYVAVVAYFATQDASHLTRFAESRASVESSLAQLRREAQVRDTREAEDLDALIATHADFAATDQQVIDSITRGDLVGAIAIALDSGLLVDSDAFLGQLRLKIDEQRQELGAAQDRQRAAEASTRRWSLGVGATCAAFLLTAALAGVWWIGQPLRRARAATRAIAAGDLSARVPEGGPAELAGLSADVNAMADALIARSDELNAYLSKNLEARTAELERANAGLEREVRERRHAEELLARTLEAEKQLEEQLRHQAFHDPLTNLANRARFMDRVEHALVRSSRSREPVAVLFMDLDDFKSVNDSLGHRAGDELLIGVAERLRTCLRPGDTVARLGGDEFAVLVEEMAQGEAPVLVAERLTEVLRAPVRVSDRDVFVRASIGLVVSTGQGEQADELLRRADVAMYFAKAQGKGRVAAYEPSMETSIVERLELANELQGAFERGELAVHYQPSIILSSGRIAGVEALVRWNHPERGLLAPLAFIPLAEETGLIIPIGRWILGEACSQARRWQAEFPSDPPLAMAVNISARQVHQPGIIDDVAEALHETGLPPNTLILEITESVMMLDGEAAITSLRALKELGVRLAIDDFGTGYSSLSYLRRFPIDMLKIDKSFVDGVNIQGKERELARSIIELGQTLNLEIVAEGVERPEQLAWLRSLRCDMGQGFYFSEAMRPEEIDELLRSRVGFPTVDEVA